MRKQKHKLEETIYCPIEATLDVIGGKWKGVILFRLLYKTMRFNELQRALYKITQRTLTQQLRELEADGVIKRKIYAEVPPRVEYSITEHGKSLSNILHSMKDWGLTHVASTSLPKELMEGCD